MAQWQRLFGQGGVEFAPRRFLNYIFIKFRTKRKRIKNGCCNFRELNLGHLRCRRSFYQSTNVLAYKRSIFYYFIENKCYNWTKHFSPLEGFEPMLPWQILKDSKEIFPGRIRSLILQWKRLGCQPLHYQPSKFLKGKRTKH